MNNSAFGSNWEEVEQELFTPEEIAESRVRVALMTEIINARKSKKAVKEKMSEMGCGGM